MRYYIYLEYESGYKEYRSKDGHWDDDLYFGVFFDSWDVAHVVMESIMKLEPSNIQYMKIGTSI
jgi:hypothetical protein